MPNRSKAGVSCLCFFLFPQQTLKLLAQRWGDPPGEQGEQSGCPGLGLSGSSSLCSLGTGRRFFYNKSCFRNSLLSPVLVCAFKPLGRRVQVGILYFSPPPVPTMSVGLVRDCVT